MGTSCCTRQGRRCAPYGLWCTDRRSFQMQKGKLAKYASRLPSSSQHCQWLRGFGSQPAPAPVGGCVVEGGPRGAIKTCRTHHQPQRRRPKRLCDKDKIRCKAKSPLPTCMCKRSAPPRNGAYTWREGYRTRLPRTVRPAPIASPTWSESAVPPVAVCGGLRQPTAAGPSARASAIDFT